MRSRKMEGGREEGGNERREGGRLREGKEE